MVSDDWDLKSGAQKTGMEDLDTWYGPVAGWVEDKCRTGLNSQMVYIDGDGKAESFTKKTVNVEGVNKISYSYKLEEIESLNRFRIYVETLSGPQNGDEDDPISGQADRVYVALRQMNTNYLTQMTMKALSESDDPQVLLDDPDAMASAIFDDPDFDMNLVYSIVYSRTITTNANGFGQLDIDIPDTWNRGLVFVQVSYGYNAQAERDNIAKAVDVKSMLVLEIVAILVGILIMMIPGINALVGPAYWALVGGMLLAEVAIFTYMDLAGMSPAGNNRYDCSFPLIDAGSIGGQTGDEISLGFMQNYVIQLGPDVVPEQPDPAIDADWLTQLEENKKIRKKNAMMWLGGIMSAFVLSIITVSTMGGEEDF